MKALRILIVEDDVEVMSMVDKTLRNEGHETRLAPNGKFGVRLAKEFKPDIVVTDILMPEKDGYEVILELRRMKSPAKVIAMSAGGHSGFMTTEIAEVLKAFKVTTFLQKPFSPEKLLEAVQKVLAPA